MKNILKHLLDPFHVFAALLLAVGLWFFPALFHAESQSVLASPLRQDCRVCADWNESCTSNGCSSHCVAWVWEPCEGGGSPNPPTVSSTVSCTMGSNGWCVGNAQLILNASDPQGYAVTITGRIGGTSFSCGRNCAVNLPPGSGTATYTATAATSGLRTSGSRNWRFDPTPPVPLLALDGVSGANGWYVSQVTASAEGMDSLSGLAAVTLSVEDGATAASTLLEDGQHSLRVAAQDVAGNTASRTETVAVDTVPPAIFISAAGNQAWDGWFTSEVDLSAAAMDATSGVDGGVALSFDNGVTWEVGSRILDSGLYDLLFRVPDRAGNMGTSQMSLKVDTQSPTIVLSEAGSLGREGWYVSPATVSAAAGDNLSGITAVQHRINGGAWIDGDFVSVQDGIHFIEFQAFDAAGNEQTASREIRVDTTPPAYAFENKLPGAVLADTVHLKGAVSDRTSAVQSAEFSSDGETWQSVSFENGDWSFDWDSSAFDNGDHILYLRATDSAGNLGEPIQVSVILDNIPPYVNLSETWNIWEGGELAVFDNGIPLESIMIIVQDPMLRFADQIIHDKLPAPKSVIWDRIIGPASAPPGTYTVTVEVCDIYGLCAKDSGTVVIPAVPTPTPTLILEEPVRRWWQLPLTLPRPDEPEPAPPAVSPPAQVPTQEPIVSVSYPLWTTFLLGLLLLLFTFLLLLDPRPAAYRSLTRRLAVAVRNE